MWDIWPEQHEVAIIVSAHVIADKALAATVQSEGQLEFPMMVPLERDAVGEPPIQERPGLPIRDQELFEERAHGVPCQSGRMNTP